MRYGDKEEWFLELEAAGDHIKALDERPSIAGVEWLWEAWLDLGTCRPIGMDAGPIPWTAVNDYALRYGLTTDEMDELWVCVRRLDHERYKHANQQRTAAPTKKATVDPRAQAQAMVKQSGNK